MAAPPIVLVVGVIVATPTLILQTRKNVPFPKPVVVATGRVTPMAELLLS